MLIGNQSHLASSPCTDGVELQWIPFTSCCLPSLRVSRQQKRGKSTEVVVRMFYLSDPDTTRGVD